MYKKLMFFSLLLCVSNVILGMYRTTLPDTSTIFIGTFNKQTEGITYFSPAGEPIAYSKKQLKDPLYSKPMYIEQKPFLHIAKNFTLDLSTINPKLLSIIKATLESNNEQLIVKLDPFTGIDEARREIGFIQEE